MLWRQCTIVFNKQFCFHLETCFYIPILLAPFGICFHKIPKKALPRLVNSPQGKFYSILTSSIISAINESEILTCVALVFNSSKCSLPRSTGIITKTPRSNSSVVKMASAFLSQPYAMASLNVPVIWTKRSVRMATYPLNPSFVHTGTSSVTECNIDPHGFSQ